MIGFTTDGRTVKLNGDDIHAIDVLKDRGIIPEDYDPTKHILVTVPRPRDDGGTPKP